MKNAKFIRVINSYYFRKVSICSNSLENRYSSNDNFLILDINIDILKKFMHLIDSVFHAINREKLIFCVHNSNNNFSLENY